MNDLADVLDRLATATNGRTEADIQADVRDVLLNADFDLVDDEVLLEAPTANGGRLDVTKGTLIIECKRRVATSGTGVAQQRGQLEGYLLGEPTKPFGVLTDGVRWEMFRRVGSDVLLVGERVHVPGKIDLAAFRQWLGAAISTEHDLAPDTWAIESRLGASSMVYASTVDALQELWADAAGNNAVALKRELWAKLLTTAFGSQFNDDDELFVEHTYLVLVANAISHAVIGYNLRAGGLAPATMLSGQEFVSKGITGVGEAGFFDWPLDVAGGDDVVATLFGSVAMFDWQGATHDVLKALYQSVISPDVRHKLGEYYTPDWLAERVVAEVVDDPLTQRVLDPSCGSGTFVFHSVRRYLGACDAAGVAAGDAVTGATRMVYGFDLHPVAVALAQTTFLLALGDKLAARSGPISVPVYLGDSMRWESQGQNQVVAPDGDVVVHTTDGAQLFASELRVPSGVIELANFDAVINEMARRAADRSRGSTHPNIDNTLISLGVDANDLPVMNRTFEVMCDLHDQDRDHIWGYYVRNQARPSWLAQLSNNVDRIVGNPPWLSYRYMAEPQKSLFKSMCESRGLWVGGATLATQQDLSALFIARSVEQFLAPGGRFGFVMPFAALSRQVFAPLRTGVWSTNQTNQVELGVAWDLSGVDPHPFPVPSSVLFGERVKAVSQSTPTPLSNSAVALAGDPGSLVVGSSVVVQLDGTDEKSPYADRFAQGATLVPRLLTLVVDDASAGPIPPQQGTRLVRSKRSTLEKEPWKSQPDLTAMVEESFIRPVFLGEHVGPFRTFAPDEAVVAFDGTDLLDAENAKLGRHPGVAAWINSASQVWLTHRSSDRLSFGERVDYHAGLSRQFPVGNIRVVYSSSGTALVAAIVTDTRAVIEHGLYWGPVATLNEALYLCSVLNAPTYTNLVAPFQSTGAFGRRHFDKYVWIPPVPLFNPGDAIHLTLVDLAQQATSIAATIDLGGQFKKDRAAIRLALDDAGISSELDKAVTDLLS